MAAANTAEGELRAFNARSDRDRWGSRAIIPFSSRPAGKSDVGYGRPGYGDALAVCRPRRHHAAARAQRGKRAGAVGVARLVPSGDLVRGGRALASPAAPGLAAVAAGARIWPCDNALAPSGVASRKLKKIMAQDALCAVDRAAPAQRDDAQRQLNDQHLIWIDMEMSGLLPDSDRILEIAVVITDAELRTVAEAPVIVLHQDDAVLDAMDAWNRGTHGRSGLTQRVRQAGLDEAAAQSTLLNFLGRYVGAGKSPMCGNSICQDRRFLARWMPQLEAYFHYRNLDVSTLKELAKRWNPQVYRSFDKHSRHEALADVYESIAELQHYRTQWLDVGAHQARASHLAAAGVSPPGVEPGSHA